jgi:hypothetical protein
MEELTTLSLSCSLSASFHVVRLQYYYNVCSLGAASFGPNTSVVLDNITLGCTGTTPEFGDWSASSCGYSDEFGWAEEAALQAQARVGAQATRFRELTCCLVYCPCWASKLHAEIKFLCMHLAAVLLQGVDLTQYNHRVLVLPPDLQSWAGPDCSWAGLGTVGPAYVAPPSRRGAGDDPWQRDGSYAIAWISGDQATTVQAYFHELGHNLGLYHAGRYHDEECETCDWSCAMGESWLGSNADHQVMPILLGASPS